MNSKQFFPVIAAILISVSQVSPVIADTGGAASYPAHYGKKVSFDDKGVLVEYSPGNGHMIIDGKKYIMSRDLKIHTLKKVESGSLDIGVGDQLGFKFTGGVNSFRVIKEIWQLPPGIYQPF